MRPNRAITAQPKIAFRILPADLPMNEIKAWISTMGIPSPTNVHHSRVRSAPRGDATRVQVGDCRSVVPRSREISQFRAPESSSAAPGEAPVRDDRVALWVRLLLTFCPAEPTATAGLRLTV